MNLLIVENEAEQVQLYKDLIDSFNKKSENTIKIEHSIFTNLDTAMEGLNASNYDAAIIDLKLSSGTENYEGLKIVEAIKSDLRFPVFIVSGNIGIVTDEENALFKKRSRDGDIKEILKEIIEIHKTGITRILGKTGIIDSYLTSIFWAHLSNSLDTWTKDNSRTIEEKEKSLLRYTLLHIQEHLDEEVEQYHPSEFYITKPIKKNIFTGDIIQYEQCRYLVLTPSCDIVLRSDNTRNADFILFCKIKTLPEVIPNYSNLGINTGKNNKAKQKLLKIMANNSKQNFYFIPKHNNIEAGVIDFQDKFTLPQNTVNEYITDNTIDRIATVSMPFLREIISKYSNYYARQGSPDFNPEELYKTLFPS